MKKIFWIAAMILNFDKVYAANKCSFQSGWYANTNATEYIIDSAFSEDKRNAFLEHLAVYSPSATISVEPAPEAWLPNKRIFKRSSYLNGSSGYTYFSDELNSNEATRDVVYSSAYASLGDILPAMIHENGHMSGLGHEDCNYKWIYVNGEWKNTQDYNFGNFNACGVMAYGSTSFTPADDFDFKRVNGIQVPQATAKGRITINSTGLKGANLIFISTTKTFKPSWKELNVRYSTIIDDLGFGDGRFQIELPPDTYKVMLVPIGDYRSGFGWWKLTDSQIANIVKPLRLNGKKTKFILDPSNIGELTIIDGQNLEFNWTVEI